MSAQASCRVLQRLMLYLSWPLSSIPSGWQQPHAILLTIQPFNGVQKEMRNRGCICSRVEERGCMYSMWNQMSCIIKPQVGHGAGRLNRIGSSPKMDFIDSARRARPSEVRQWPDWDAVTDPSASSVKSLELEWKIGRSPVDYVRIMKSFRSKIEEDI